MDWGRVHFELDKNGKNVVKLEKSIELWLLILCIKLTTWQGTLDRVFG